MTGSEGSKDDLNNNPAYLSSIVDSAMDAIITVDRSQHILLFNDAAEKMFGTSAASVIGEPLDHFIPQRFRAAHGQHIEHFGRTGETNRRMGHLDMLWGLRTSGQEFPIEASISHVEVEGRKLFTVILRDITEKVRITEELRESEERQRLFIENAPVALAMFDHEMRYLAHSQCWLIDYQLENEKIIGRSHYEVFPEITDQWKEFHRRGLQGETIVTDEDHFTRLDGTVQWLRWGIYPWYMGGEIGGIIIFSEDITGRKTTEEELSQSEANLRAILNNTLQAFLLFDSDRRVRAANTVAKDWTRMLTGIELQVGQRPDALISGFQAERFEDAFNRALDGELVQREVTFETAEQSLWFETNYTPVTRGTDEIVGISLSILNITRRKQAEAVLRQSQTQLKHIVDTVPEGVFLLDTDGTIRLSNPAADRFLDILAPEIEGRRLTLLGGRPLNELLTSPPKGLWHEIAIDDLVFESIARPIETSAENEGWVLVLRDVTRRKDIEQRAQQQDRLAAVGQLAAGIAHDFNNIIAVITLYAQIVPRMVELPAAVQERLQTIVQQSARASDLIQQILDFSRRSILERIPLDLAPFVKGLVELLRRTLPEHIQIQFVTSGEGFLIHADPSRIQQVLMNLAVNARDAMPEGGQLQISLTTAQTEAVTPLLIGDLPAGEWVLVQVADSGSGIPPEAMLQIFEPFFTTKAAGQGTGLGLAQVYGIVRQHDCFIDVRTTVGEGTTFSLYFPVLEGDANLKNPLNMDSLKVGQGQTILLVEDNPITRQAFVDSLILLNYEVIEATNGREALAILEALGDDIALVLSDAVMPEMGGIALWHAMRQQELVRPMILTSGHPLDKEIGELQKLGLAGWLPKPPELTRLSQLLAQVLAT